MGLLDRLRNILPGGGGNTAIPRDPVTYRPIGVVRNRVKESMPGGWETVRSDILLREDLVDSVDWLGGFSHVIVIFHMDRIPDEERRLTIPVGNEEEPPERGILATRSQLRPNPIGISVVQVLHRRAGVLRVRGLDALDGSPVLDLKPYLPQYDAVFDATLPAWALRK